MKTIISKPIFDIFSSRKTSPKKEEPRINIIADYREKNCLVASELAKLGIDVEFKELKVADYIVRETAIERKTVSDFISSMINKRLFRQLEEISQFPNRLLIIEGIEEKELYSDEKQGVQANAIRGFLLSILLKYKVPVIFSKNSQDTARFISVLARKQTKETSLNPTKKALTPKEQKQFILEGFPGIGPTNSKKLLENYKTIKNIINQDENELSKIIGKKAELIKKIIDEEY